MLTERKLTERELESREVVLKGLLKNKRNLVKRYGKDAEKVMYGIATNKAKTKVEGMNKERIKELIVQSLTAPVNEGHGLDQGDLDFLKSFVDRMGYDKEPVKAEEFSKLKKILKFIIKSNILQDKTKDLSKGKVDENIIKEFISGPLGKRNDALFDKLVPGSGDSETVEGEMIRAINRIIYRFFNDGDYFYRGYGAETAGPAHSFLINSNQIPFDIQSTLTSIFDKAMGADEDGYERLIKFALEKVVDHVEATPEDEYTKLDRGMFDFESEFEDEEEEDDYDDYYDEEEEDYYMNEEKEDINKILQAQKIIKKVLKNEGGAAGLKPIVDALKDLKIKKDELIKILKKTVGVVKHQHGDYIIKPIEEIKEGVEKRMFTYLSDLRDSGVTNMFGAAPYLANEFGLDKRTAREILAKWMKSFGESIDLKINSIVKEKLTKRHKVGDFVDDFQKSDAKQFKGKSDKKKKEMAVAAYLSKQND
tara:strand:+ start:2600 stop:4036 length:1437 start_codon:yes stop_codon:yes gene_type:complete